MEQLLSEVLEYLITLENYFIYLFIFICSIIENIFPPAPGDTVTAFGAFLAGTGRLNFFLLYAVTTAGSSLGFMVLFFLGRYLQRDYLFIKNVSFFPADKIEYARRWFRKYGYSVIIFNRFFPGIRSVISIASGMSGLKVLPVFVFSAISAMLWNLIWIYAGYTLGCNWEDIRFYVLEITKNYNYTAGTFVLMIFIYLLFKLFKRESAG